MFHAGNRLIYLLNRRYASFYKWMRRGMEELPILNYTGGLFAQLTVGDTANDRNMKIMDEICSAAAQEWNRQGLIQEKNPDPFLQIYLDELMAGIRNPQIRSLHWLQG